MYCVISFISTTAFEVLFFILFHLCASLFQETTNANICFWCSLYYISKVHFIYYSQNWIKISIFIFNGNYLFSRILVLHGKSYILNQAVVHFCLEKSALLIQGFKGYGKWWKSGWLTSSTEFQVSQPFPTCIQFIILLWI